MVIVTGGNMAGRPRKTTDNKQPKDKLLPKLTTTFFDRPRLTALIWLIITVFGIASYTNLLKREGFPSVNIPLTVVTGTYFVNDPAKVDQEVAKPLSDLILKNDRVKAVQAGSADNFFSVTVQYKPETDAKTAAKDLEVAVKDARILPANANIQYNVPYFGATGGDSRQIDIAASFYKSDSQTTTTELAAKAEAAAKWLNDQHLSTVKSVFVKNPLQQVTNPATGQQVTVQRNFDRYGVRNGDHTDFYDSVIIGVAAADNVDVIQLDAQVRTALDKLEQQPEFIGYQADVSASFAPSIKESISELQRVLLEGLLAILIVGSIVIAVRASIITVLSMVTVLVATLGLLYLVGYTLNVITLFALILGLSLIVDDTIIMVEAIDAARHHHKDRRTAVQEATRKVSRAMVAATATAALSFAPLLFVSGVLGSFIKAIPVTIIAALIISLLVALVFIPFFARFLLLGKKQMGRRGVTEVAAGFEAKVAAAIARPMLWARHSRAKLFGVGIVALVIGFGFVAAGLAIARNVTFNIFPPTKDTNGLVLNLNLPPNTTIQQAQTVADHADRLAADVLGDNFVRSSYYETGSAQSATVQIAIKPYTERAVTSPQLVKQLQTRFDSEFHEAQVAVGQLDVGPPAAAFTVQIDASNRPAALQAANDLATYLAHTELKRPSGKSAHLTNTAVSSPNQYLRTDSRPIITVTAGFDGTDTTTLVTLAQDAVKKEFTPDKLAAYGLGRDAIRFDIGQESENQDSFKTLALAFPALLIVIFILLAIQFRSWLQPLLIFMAIPFSIFGVMLGLDITNNAISFFTMMGFFALIGLSIKNTILLTDFANQARHQGLSAIDSAVAALEERFRPLFATSMTAVVSLIPLALYSPFWEGLAVVLIFGLLSSTFLVITVFPYYYLGAEYLRLRIRATSFFMWLVPTLAVAVLAGLLGGPVWAFLALPLSLYLIILHAFFSRRLASARR